MFPVHKAFEKGSKVWEGERQFLKLVWVAFSVVKTGHRWKIIVQLFH